MKNFARKLILFIFTISSRAGIGGDTFNFFFNFFISRRIFPDRSRINIDQNIDYVRIDDDDF